MDIIDERAGVAGADVVVEESGAPVLLVVRLKVAGDKLTEVELVATRSAAEGLIFNIDGLSAPSEVMNYAPRPEQLSTRDEAIKAALHYPAGLNAAKTFADVDAPFAAGASRYENGAVMAGPDCKFAPGCQNIATQSLEIFKRLGDVQTRVVAVDERMGIVWLRMAWGVRERGGDQLTVWESFKVYDGKIHAVEAFMRILPVEKRNGGWGCSICSADFRLWDVGKLREQAKTARLRTPLARPIGRGVFPAGATHWTLGSLSSKCGLSPSV